jgi:hypothetical protein
MKQETRLNSALPVFGFQPRPCAVSLQIFCYNIDGGSEITKTRTMTPPSDWHTDSVREKGCGDVAATKSQQT